MKKITLVISALFLSTNVAFALDNIVYKDHSNVALDHAKNAATAKNADEVVHHAGAALEHTLTASISAKGVAKNHLDEGAKQLQKAIDQGKLGKFNSSISYSEAAAVHISAANSTVESSH
jgi:type II secretory pathway component PulM